ncbi:MAG TPA: hypothetical protein DEO83_04820 [Lachnospiraceae bacterium]|nr:hypothetical protein [Lachnospiraceae bacterium]
MKMIKKIRKIVLISIIAICFCSINTYAKDNSESDGLMPTGEENIVAGDSGYWHAGKLERSRLFVTETGFIRIFYTKNNTIVEKYDNDLNILSKTKIKHQMESWGGAYYYNGMVYVVESNYGENDEGNLVLKVFKYDMKGNQVDCSVINDKGYYSFARSTDICEYNGKLYIASDYSCSGHTGLRLIEVDTSTMSGKIINSNLFHSFKQYLNSDSDNIYLLELSEGSRAAQVSKLIKADGKTGKNTIDVYKYGGVRTTSLAITCYADVNGITSSKDNILTVGASIDQNKYNTGSTEPWNLYVTVTPKNDFTEESTIIRNLTNYTDYLNDVYSSSITKISDDRFLVAWELHRDDKEPIVTDIDDALSSGDFHYIFIDGDGNKISEEFTAEIPISDCQPVVKNNKVVYYSSISNMVTFYCIDAYDGTLSKKMYRVAGEYASWNIKKDTLVISGKGSVDFYDENHWIRSKNYIYWAPAFQSIEGDSINDVEGKVKIKRILIKKGITGINDDTFTYMRNVTDLYIESGLKSIGNNCFTYCENIRNVYLPSTVKQIGKDFGWKGSYWVGSESKVFNYKIIAVKGSYAIKYAKKKKLEYSALSKAIKIKNVTRKKSKLTLKWKAVSKVTGYQIEYSTDPDYILNTKRVKVKGKAKTKKVISKLKSKKTYYVRIRSYKNKYADVYKLKKGKWVKKKEVYETIYSEWSDSKKTN